MAACGHYTITEIRKIKEVFILKKQYFALSALMLLAGLVGGSALAVSIPATQNKPTYEVNQSGLTYGHVNPKTMSWEQYPDLISAIGVDGADGYVYKDQVHGEQPETPEEALEYMAQLEKEAQAMKRSDSAYLRYIPLYAEDGCTVIGEFGISYPSGIQ